VSFPVSLVPVAKAPRPHRCRGNAICFPIAARPPRASPFVFLGSTSGGTPMSPAADPPGSKSDLRFDVPEIGAGRYALVIFCAGCAQGPSASLIADTRSGQLLRILPRHAPSDSGDGGGATWWIVGGIAAIGLALAGVLLLRRRRPA
jgi:hypothetical protein